MNPTEEQEIREEGRLKSIEEYLAMCPFGPECEGCHDIVFLLAELTRERERAEKAEELLRIAFHHLGAGDHDCTGPEDCWTCATREVLSPTWRALSNQTDSEEKA